MASCQPNVTCDESNRHDYITDFNCSLGIDEEELDDALKSFPSAHASFAAFMAFFLVIYIHERWKAFTYSTRVVIRPLLQLAILAVYWWSALTRVSDFVHHPLDVVAGLILGTLVALASWPHFLELQRDIKKAEADNSNNHETSLKFSIK